VIEGDNMNDLIQYNDNTKIASKEDINIYLAQEFIDSSAPIATMAFPTADHPIIFYQTRETLADLDKYKAFIDNCIRRFRKSRAYKGYKAYLMSLGMDRCQINGNIQDGMADIEMHHNFLTIYDITILISQHILNTVGRCTTFDIVALLIQEHRENNIPIVMLTETAHQLYHNNPDMYIPLSMTFGQWWNLLAKYSYGITLDIAYKVINYIKNCQNNNELTDLQFYKLRDNIRSWGEYNEYNYYHFGSINNRLNSRGYINSPNSFEIYGSNSNNRRAPQEEAGSRRVYTEEELFGAGF